MRWWLLTTTTYGTWLPGNPRGSVTSVRDRRAGEAPSEARREHDRFGEEWEGELRGLFVAAKSALRGPSVAFDVAGAEAVLEQFQETCNYRGWTLEAVGIMASHCHTVAAAPREVDGDKLLGDLKAYASRRLNRTFGPTPSNEWWTQGGSKRPIADDAHLAAAVDYTLYRQENSLVVWSRTHGRLV